MKRPAQQKDSTITVFYSWQSDLAPQWNRHFIKKALRSASATCESAISTELQSSISIEIDEATRNQPGSPNIPQTILDKIRRSDLFVADISFINEKFQGTARRHPNPNVTFELGYAVAELGWGRIILVLNTASGPVENLPFDFNKHRVTTYRFDGASQKSSELQEVLTVAMRLIVEHDPPRPADQSLDTSSAQRSRDLAKIRQVLSCVHLPTLDHHIRSGPKILSGASEHSRERLSSLVHSSLFHLYDQKLSRLLRAFVGTWLASVKYDHYEPHPNSHDYIFTHSGGFNIRSSRGLKAATKERAREEKEFDYMFKARTRMGKQLKLFLKYIREFYPELDVDQLSVLAGASYQDYLKEFEP